MLKFFLTWIGIVLAVPGALAQYTPIQQSNANQLRCQYSLVQNTISVGEPIIVHVQITNIGHQTAPVYLGEYNGYWWNVSLRDGAGTLLPALPTPVPFPSPLGRLGPSLAPGTSDQEVVVLSTMVRPAQPGRYVILVHARLPNSMALDAAVFEDTASLPLTVTPADPQKLHAAAVTLQKAILTETDPEKKDIAIKALFSMPESAVFVTWKSLASDTSIDPFVGVHIAWQIEQVGSPGACDLLALMAQTSPERWSCIGQSPIEDLIALHRTAAPVMKSYIDATLKKNGWTIPARLFVQGPIY